MNYYSNIREEVLPFIPKECNKFLEIGCGEGHFAELLKNTFNSEVWGIELNEESANIAKSKLDKVITGDFNTIIPTLPKKYFNCIIFNDVLEHFAYPFEILKDIKPILTEDGYIVSSIPNVRYIGNLKRLLINKDWEYLKEGGILDYTHLRFFTEKSIKRMFKQAGYIIENIKGINGLKLLKFSLLNLITLGTLSDTKYPQFVCVAKNSSDNSKSSDA